MSGKCHYIDNIGERFGRLIVIERIENYISKNGKNRVRYKCLCDCGNFKEVLKESLMNDSTKSCGCLRKQLLRNKVWKGYKEISGRLISAIKSGAKSRGFEYNLSNEYLWNLFIKQDRKCALTGYDIKFTANYKNFKNNQTASLDRIDSTKGYVEGNVQWVHKDINKLKWDWSLEKFYELCESVVNFKLLKGKCYEEI